MRLQQRSALLFTVFGCMCAIGAAAQNPATPTIPLCPGLTIVTAVAQQNGDYESIKTIESASPKEVRLRYSAEMYNSDWLASGPAQLKNLTLHRTILISDLESANIYQQKFLEKSAETVPGTTAIGISAAVLRALTTKGQAELSVSNAYAGLELTADRNKSPSYYQYMQPGKIRKVGAGPVRVPVLVNDRL